MSRGQRLFDIEVVVAISLDLMIDLVFFIRSQIVKASTFSSLVSLELSAAPPLVPNSAGSKVLWMTEKVLAEVLSKAEDHP